MAPIIPKSTQWITFPVQPKSAVMVDWAEGSVARNNLYYHTKCYWGTLKDPKTQFKQAGSDGKRITRSIVNGDINIEGETRLFLAHEYVESQYQGGPLKPYHIRDLAGINDQIQGQGPLWITMQLNDSFHFGQHGKGNDLRRWIVYHPPVGSKTKPPRMFQHRFTGLASEELVKAGAEQLPSVAPGALKLAGHAGNKLVGAGTKAAVRGIGDELHEFLGEDDMAYVNELQKKAQIAVPNVSTFTPDFKNNHLIAVLLVESLKSTKDYHVRKGANVDLKALQGQVAEEAQYYHKLVSCVDKGVSWWDGLFNKAGTKKPDANSNKLPAPIPIKNDGRSEGRNDAPAPINSARSSINEGEILRFGTEEYFDANNVEHNLRPPVGDGDIDAEDLVRQVDDEQFNRQRRSALIERQMGPPTQFRDGHPMSRALQQPNIKK